MAHRHYTSVSQIPKPPAFTMSPAMHFGWLGLLLIGLISFFVTLKSDPARAWHNFLLNYFYWLCLGLSGIFFVALQHITSSMWSVPLRRVPEAFVAWLPPAVILFFVLLAGSHHLFEWTHADLGPKSAYLNTGFFTVRNILFLLIWTATGFWFLKNSLKQDQTGSVALTFLNKNISAPFLVVFGITFTMASIDLLMSLDPHWFSTIFGVYCFAGLFESGLAMMILFVAALRRQGALREVVNENHLHDLGKLLFAFCVFWAYIAFSQYMLIWYANLPEETGYLIRRTTGPWLPVVLLLLFGKFILPFCLLLGRLGKRHSAYLVCVSVWVLAMQWVDCYWMIFPMLKGGPVFGWQEVGIFLGFLGLFVLSVTAVLQRIQPMPLKDPRLLEGVNHHQ